MRAPHAVALPRDAARVGRASHLRLLLKHALSIAHVYGYVFVLPELPCGAPWMQNESTPLRPYDMSDKRVIVDSTLACHVGAHAYEFCWPWDFLVSAFDPLVRERRPRAIEVSIEDLEAGLHHKEVVLDRVPIGKALQLEKDIAVLKKQCPGFFD